MRPSFFPLGILLLCCSMLMSGGCVSGKKGVADAAAYSRNETRNLDIFIIPNPGGDKKLNGVILEQFEESMYIPQTLAAYYGAGFTKKNNAYYFDFSNDISWRIISRKNIEEAGGIVLRSYRVEARGQGGSPEGGAYYTCTISIDDSAVREKQPALAVLEICVRKSKTAKGRARIDSLRFDESSGKITAVVVVAGE